MSINQTGNENTPYPHQPLANDFLDLINNLNPGPTRAPFTDSIDNHTQAQHSASAFDLDQDQAFFLPRPQPQPLESFDSNSGANQFQSISAAGAQEEGGQLRWQSEHRSHRSHQSGIGIAGFNTQNQDPGGALEGLFANIVAAEPQYQPEADSQAGSEWPLFGLFPEGAAVTQVPSSGGVAPLQSGEASPTTPAWWVQRTDHRRISVTAAVSPSIQQHHPLHPSERHQSWNNGLSTTNNTQTHPTQTFASPPNSSFLDSIQYPFQQAHQGYQAYQNLAQSPFLAQPPPSADPFLAPPQPSPQSRFDNPNGNFPSFAQNNDDSLQQGHGFPNRLTSSAQNQAPRPSSIPLNHNRLPPPLPTALPNPTMPPSRKRTTATATATTSKRSHVSNEEQDKRKRLCIKLEGDDDLSFGSGSRQSQHEIIDLVDAEEIPEEVLKEKEREKEKKLTRLAGFQCVICMDDCTDLVVTSCGHLFCGPCIHESLHTSAAKSLCPMCRQNIIPRSHTAKNRGRFHLKIKKRGKLVRGRASKKRRAR